MRLRFPELLRDVGFPAASPLKSRFVNVSGGVIHSRSSTDVEGGEEPVVLIHGLVISSLYMIPLAECLASHGAVHALDLPGFGRSQAPRGILTLSQLADAVVAWLDAAEIEKGHLVANSMGCEIAAHVAVKVPRRVLSLTLIGPTVDSHTLSVRAQILGLVKDAVREPARLWMNWAFDFFRAGIRRSIGTAREMFEDDIQTQLPLIAAPTLIVRGGTDPTVPQFAVEQMRGLLPNARVEVFKGEPHCVHYTQPERICAVIRDHMQTSRGT